MDLQYIGTKLSDQAKQHLLLRHYIRRLPKIMHGFELLCGKNVVGVMTFGYPASRHLQVGVCPESPKSVLELSRLWICDTQKHGTASWLISQVLRQMPAAIIVSYADTTAGHDGTVYRAANFFYAGWTDMDRKTPRYDYISQCGGHSRNTFRSGQGSEAVKVRRRPKARYWTTTGSKKEKRALTKSCQWPKMDWKSEPVPTEHKKL